MVRLYAGAALARSGREGWLVLAKVVESGNVKAAVSAAEAIGAAGIEDRELDRQVTSRLSKLATARDVEPAVQTMIHRAIRSLGDNCEQ